MTLGNMREVAVGDGNTQQQSRRLVTDGLNKWFAFFDHENAHALYSLIGRILRRVHYPRFVMIRFPRAVRLGFSIFFLSGHGSLKNRSVLIPWMRVASGIKTGRPFNKYHNYFFVGLTCQNSLSVGE